MAELTLAARLILAATFSVAGAAKLLDRGGTRRAVAAYGVPASVVVPIAVLLPVAELAVAAASLTTIAAVGAAMAALALLVAFMVAIAATLARGQQPDCGCFGLGRGAPAGGKALARDAALAALAALVVAEGPGASLTTWWSGLTRIDWLEIGVGCALAGALAVETSLLLTRWRRARRARPPVDR